MHEVLPIAIRVEKKEYPHWVCDGCGIEANRLTCLKKYGEEPLQAKFSESTYHEGKCEVCGEEKMITEVRDFFYPDFGLLKTPFEKAIERSTGWTIEEIRSTPLCEIRKRVEAVKGPMRILTDRGAISHQEVENILSKALR